METFPWMVDLADDRKALFPMQMNSLASAHNQRLTKPALLRRRLGGLEIQPSRLAD